MAKLKNMQHEKRSEAVMTAFYAAINTGTQLVDVTFDRRYNDKPITRRYKLVGCGWNPSYAGASEALIVQDPDRAVYAVDFIPYTRLISIIPVVEP